MDKEDFDCMCKAIEAAKYAITREGNPFGCCVSVNGCIVSTAYNTTDIDYDPTAHAEINAIRQACMKSGVAHLENSTIYATTEPCLMCMAAIYWAGISRVVYGTRLEEAIYYGFDEIHLHSEELSNYFPRKIEIIGGILDEEVRDVFKQWAINNRLLIWYKKNRHISNAK